MNSKLYYSLYVSVWKFQNTDFECPLHYWSIKVEWASVLNHQVVYGILRGPLLYVTRFFCSKSWLAVILTRNPISKISDLFFCEILKSTHDAHWTLINKIVFLKLIIRFWIRPNFTSFCSKQLNQVQCTVKIKTVCVLKKNYYSVSPKNSQ